MNVLAEKREQMMEGCLYKRAHTWYRGLAHLSAAATTMERNLRPALHIIAIYPQGTEGGGREGSFQLRKSRIKRGEATWDFCV